MRRALMTEERLVGVFTVLFTLIMEDGRGTC